jgi:hypothetical protein
MLVGCCISGILANSVSFMFKPILQYYGVGITVFLLATAILGRGMRVMKSDRDYLLTLPIEKKELALNLYLVQIISFIFTNVVFFGILVSVALAIGGGLSYILLPVDLVALAVLFSSLDVIASVLSKKMKIVLGAFLSLWVLSALWGVPFSLGSIFTEQILYGSIVLLISAILSTVIALKKLSNIEFKVMNDLIRASSSDMEKNRVFNGISRFRAIFSLNFSAVKSSGTFSMKTTLMDRIINILSRPIILSCIFALIYVLLLPQLAAENVNLVVTLHLLPLMFFITSTYQRGLSKERAWLSFTSMDPMLYFRYVSVAKALSWFSIALPFAIANIILMFLGFQTILPIISILITIPCLTIFTLYWGSITNVVQLREEVQMIQTQTNLKQWVTAIPYGVFFFVYVLSLLLPMLGIITAFVLLGVTLFLLCSRYPWRMFVEKLTEQGFV